jgi:heterodisulfide reductase subunit C
MAEQAAKQASQKEPIKASELDQKWKYELQKLHGAEGLMRCFQCGTCTSDCPVSRFTDNYRPRTLIHMAQLGLKDRVLKSDTLGSAQHASHALTAAHKSRSRKRNPRLP